MVIMLSLHTSVEEYDLHVERRFTAWDGASLTPFLQFKLAT